MKVLEYIKGAKQYIYQFGVIEPFKSILESNEEEQYLIVPNSLAFYGYKKDFEKLFEQYNVAEIFELSNCFLGTYNEPYMLIHITKRCVKEIRIATFIEPAHLYRDDSFDPLCGTVRWCREYREEYLAYLDKVDQWRGTDIIPDDVEYKFYFRNVKSVEFRGDIINPRFYLEINDKIRSILRNDEIKELHEVADILKVKGGHHPVKIGRVIGNRSMPIYPYIPEKECEKYPITDVRVHKGDIIEKRGAFFLVNKEPAFELYAAPSCNVIRAKDVSPEYLYIYLTSEIARKIRTILTIPIGDKWTVSGRKIEEFPIVAPQHTTEYYAELFKKISNPDERFFEKILLPEKEDSVGAVLDLETLTNFKLSNEELLRTHINSDIEELKICFDNKAYKSMMIMAGAILEAFLIDWKSEIDGVNYFKENLEIDKEDGTTGKADLKDYINLLYKEYKPKWNSISKKAHMIRKKRNLVHAKLCLNKAEEITERLCLEIMDNLKEIVKSREEMTR